MLVVLPSEEPFDVPADVKTVKQLKARLETATGIPVVAQRLFVGAGELRDDISLGSLPDGSRIELAPAAGGGDGRDAVRERFGQHASEVSARSFDAFTGSLAADIENALSAFVDERKQEAMRKAVAPFYSAFEKHRAERLQALRRTRAQLAPGPVVISTFNWGYRSLVSNWAA